MFGLFGAKKQSIALTIDIGSTSIGGAFVVFKDGETPLMPYMVRESIDFPDEKRSPVCMVRALETVMNALDEQGLPALSRTARTHHVDRVFVSLSSPWQDIRVETKVIADGKPFVFSREMLANAVRGRASLADERKELQVEVTATLLNGYQTDSPFGKRAERAEILLLSSSMDGETMGLVNRATKRFGARQGTLISPLQSLAHAVLRAQYPHDKDFLLMVVSDEATDVLFAHHGIIMDATSIGIGLARINRSRKETMRTLRVNEGPTETSDEAVTITPEDEGAWAGLVTDALKEFATRHALPRMVFLVTNDGSADSLKRLLDTPQMHALWLSDEPLTIIPVVTKLLSSFIHHQGSADADVMLDLVTLFAELKLKSS